MIANKDTDKMDEWQIKEDVAFQNVMKMWSQISNIFGFLIRVDGKVVSYVVREWLDEFIIRETFMKAQEGYNRIAIYWMYEQLSDKTFLINAGSDGGLPGLRKSKSLENPIVMCEKHRVEFILN